MLLHSVFSFASYSLSQFPLPLQGAMDPLSSLNFWLPLCGVINGGGSGTYWGQHVEHPCMSSTNTPVCIHRLPFLLHSHNLFIPEYTPPSAIYFVCFKHYFPWFAKSGHRWKAVTSKRGVVVGCRRSELSSPWEEHLAPQSRSNCIVK